MNETRIGGMLGFAMRAGKLTLGTEQVCLALAKQGEKKPRLVLVASDASDSTKKKVRVKAEFYSVPALDLPYTGEEIGKKLGKLHTPMAIAVMDDGFARELKAALLSEITNERQ